MQETSGQHMNTSLSNTMMNTQIIPFADESGRSTEPERLADDLGDDLGESAREEFGDARKRVSVVDQDLGLGNEDQRGARGRYACPCCGEGARRVMRVRVVNPQHGHSRWVALCAVCAASMLSRVPGTIVGGLVRPTRRRRPMRVQAAGVVRQEGQLGFRGRGACYRRAG